MLYMYVLASLIFQKTFRDEYYQYHYHFYYHVKDKKTETHIWSMLLWIRELVNACPVLLTKSLYFFFFFYVFGIKKNKIKSIFLIYSLTYKDIIFKKNRQQ